MKHFKQKMMAARAGLLALRKEARWTDSNHLLEVEESVSMMGRIKGGTGCSLWIQVSEKVLTCSSWSAAPLEHSKQELNVAIWSSEKKVSARMKKLGVIDLVLNIWG